jgi:hypothetical protein
MPQKWLIRFLIIDLLLVGAHLLWGEQIYVLNLDYERTIPAYYSGLKLVIISSLFFLIFKLTSFKKEKITYFLLSAFFVMLAFDEISELHENLGEYFLGVFNNYNLFNQESFMWLIFLSPLIVFVLALLGYFLYLIRSRFAFRFVLFGLIAFCLVIITEFVGGLVIHEHQDFYKWTIVFEELMEKVGASFFIAATLSLFIEKFSQKFQVVNK